MALAAGPQAALITLLVGLAVFFLLSALTSKDAYGERLDALFRAREARLSGTTEDEEDAQGLKHRIAGAIVRRFRLRTWFSSEAARLRLVRAGKRSSSDEAVFLLSKVFGPLLMVAIAAFYTFGLKLPNVPLPGRLVVVGVAAVLGFRLPDMMLNSLIKERQEKIRASWPDALDLMLILVAGGRSVEAAFRKVSDEIEPKCAELAEELEITLAELEFLPEKRMAYENLGARIDLDEVKSACMALVQADVQGTPLSEIFRILGREGRERRLQIGEQKAAAVEPKLAVPQMIFFLVPVMIIGFTPFVIDYLKLP